MPSNLGVIGNLGMPLDWKPVVDPERIVLPWQRLVDYPISWCKRSCYFSTFYPIQL